MPRAGVEVYLGSDRLAILGVAWGLVRKWQGLGE